MSTQQIEQVGAVQRGIAPDGMVARLVLAEEARRSARIVAELQLAVDAATAWYHETGHAARVRDAYGIKLRPHADAPGAGGRALLNAAVEACGALSGAERLLRGCNYPKAADIVRAKREALQAVCEHRARAVA